MIILLISLLCCYYLCPSNVVLAEADASHMTASHFDSGGEAFGLLQEPRGAFKSAQLDQLSHSSKSRSRGNGGYYRMSSSQCEVLSRDLCRTCRASTQLSALSGRCISEKQCNRSFITCKKRARAQFNSRCYGVTTSRRQRGRKRRPRQLKRKRRGGNKGKGKGGNKRYYPMRFSCGAPTNFRIAPQDECGEVTSFNFDFTIDFTTYCATEVDNTPGLQIEERSRLEEAIKNYFNKESECFEEDPCERIDYQAIAVNEFLPADICSENAALGDGRMLQRRKRSSRSKGRGSGRCRSRKKKCNRKKKGRVLLMIDRDETGTHVIREAGPDTESDEEIFNLRRSRKAEQESRGQGYERGADRDLQQSACAAEIDLVKEMKLTGYEGFQRIDAASVEEVVPADNCRPGQIECDIETTCCSRANCRCDSASESYCAIGTEGLGVCQLYNDEGENLCCALNPFPPLAFLYPSCDCGPLPVPQCSKQGWIKPARGSQESGAFQVKAEMSIIQLCGDEFEVRRALKRVAFKYVQELIEFGGCGRNIEILEDGIEITNIKFSGACDSDSGSGIGDGNCIDATSGQQLGLTTADLIVTGSYVDFVPTELPLESLDLRRKLLDRDGRGGTRLLQRGDCECNSYICMLLREELSGDLKKNIVSADAETFAVDSVESDPSRPCVPFSKACGVGDTCCGHPSFNSQLVCNIVPVEEDRSLCCIPEGQECGSSTDTDLPALVNGGCCDTACNEVGQRKICCNDIDSCTKFLI